MATRAPRNTLSRERVLAAALELADELGVEALTIRRLAAHLEVRPMSLYHYVATKEELLDALVDSVFAEIHRPDPTRPWREQLELRTRSSREVFARHRWAPMIMETRRHPGPETLAGHEAVLDVLRSNGFSVEAAGHAYAVLDAFSYGFAVQESMLATVGLEDSAPELVAGMDFTAAPRIAELAAVHLNATTNPLDESFEIGLTIALDGIARLQ